MVAVHGKHEDAEEFLRTLIENCANLSNLTHFNTKERHFCSICGRVSEATEELNRDVKSCPIDKNFQHENTADMVQRTNPITKICSVCKTMNSEDDISHNVTESYTRLPQVHIVSAKRFHLFRVKVTKRVFLSHILEIGGETYYLKTVVRHHEFQGIEKGHYTTALNFETLWVICDDSLDFLITGDTPFDGYVLVFL